MIEADEKEVQLEKLTNQIQLNTQTLEELNHEKKKRLEQFEENSWQYQQLSKQVNRIYSDMIILGDYSAEQKLKENQEWSKHVQQICLSQKETFESTYKQAQNQLEDSTSQLQRDREELIW